MRKFIVAALAAVAIALGATSSAQADPVPISPEHAVCLANITRPVVPMLGPDQDGGYWPAYKIPFNWRDLAYYQCWVEEMVRQGEM